MAFVIVSGNIGSGKSTLSAALARAMGGQHLPEEPDDYVFLSDFYHDMARWAFHSQLQFIIQKFDQQRKASSLGRLALQDGSAYESYSVFSHKMRDDSFIGQREFQSLSNLYELLAEVIPPPDLLLHLTAPTNVLLSRIKTRGRNFEQTIPAAYLGDLEARYRSWTDAFSRCPLLRVDTSSMDFSAGSPDIQLIVQQVRRALEATGSRLTKYADGQ